MDKLLLSICLLSLLFVLGCESQEQAQLRLKQEEAKTLGVEADSLMEMGQVDEALATINQAIELDGGLSELHESRGYIHDSIGQFSEAIVDYRTALELNPDNFWAKNNYASVLCLSPNPDDRNGEEAVRLGKELVASAERSGDRMRKTFAHDTLGSAYAELGRFEEAIESCETAIKSAARAELATIQLNIRCYRDGIRTRYPEYGSDEVVPENE